MTKTIAIIGAGMSGLACAKQLMQAGHQVTIFEKSRGPSGRVSTRVSDGWQCDHGAQYFTASHPLFLAQVQSWEALGVATPWQGRIFETDGTQLRAKQAEKKRYVGVPKNTAPARQLAESCHLQLEHTIDQLQHVQGQWQLHSKEQGAYAHTFDCLVLAIPSVQAHVLLAEHQAAFALLAHQAKMRGCWTVMARYDNPLQVPFDGLFVNQGPLSWVARDSSKPGRITAGQAVKEVWVLQAQAQWSEAHIEDAPETVIAQMVQAFEAIGGQVPTAATAHRWRYADTEQPLQQQYAWDAALQLGMCGDWLNGGKVEGAWLSGTFLAQHMISHNT